MMTARLSLRGPRRFYCNYTG